MKQLLSRLCYFLCLALVSLILVSACSPGKDRNTILVPPPQNCHIVRHSMGETCVPNDPQRMVTIFHATLGNVLRLGMKPIGASIVNAEVPFPKYLSKEVGGIEWVGTQGEPNLEKILMLKPDLIMVFENIKAIYPLLSKIAPTVVTPWRGPSAWRDQIEFVAKVLAKEQESKQVWSAYYQRINQLKATLGDRYQNKTVSVFAPSTHWGFFIQAKNSFAGSILQDLGLQRPKSQDVDTTSGYVMFSSHESLDLIDGDILFVMTQEDKEERKAFEALLQTPLGKHLKAVQKGHVYFVDSFAWLGANFLATDVILDDLEKYLVNTP